MHLSRLWCSGHLCAVSTAFGSGLQNDISPTGMDMSESNARGEALRAKMYQVIGPGLKPLPLLTAFILPTEHLTGRGRMKISLFLALLYRR